MIAFDLGGQDPQEILHVPGDERPFGHKEMGLNLVVGVEDPEGDQGRRTGKSAVAFLDHVVHEGRGKGSCQTFLAEFELGAVIADGNDLLGIDILVVEKGGIQVLDRAFLPVPYQGKSRKLSEIQEITGTEIPPGSRPPVMLFEELVGGGEDQDFLSHWDMGQEGIRRIIHAQQHIQFLVQHQLDQFLRILEGSDDIHFGIHPMELGQDIGKQDMRPGGIEAQMDLPDLAFFDFLDLQGQVFSRLEIRSRVFRRAMPDSVMVSRGVRSNSRVPSSVSKCLICSLRHCWVTWARLAARVKFISSTASRNIFCEVSIASSFRVQERFASFILSQGIPCEYMENVLFYIVNKVCYFYYKSQRIMKNITREKRWISHAETAWPPTLLRRSLRIQPEDSVMCVLEDAHKGDTVETPEGEKIVLLEAIEFGHKVAIKDLKKGDPVIKYGEEIGYMLSDAPKGTWIHMHNMGCDRGKI